MSSRSQYGTLPVDPRRRNKRSMVFALFACVALAFCSIVLLGVVLSLTTGDDDGNNTPPSLIDPLCGAYSDVAIDAQPITSVCGPPSCTCAGGGVDCIMTAVVAGNSVDDSLQNFGCSSQACSGELRGTPSTCNPNTPMRTCNRTIDAAVVPFYCVEPTPAPTPAPVCPPLADVDESLQTIDTDCITSTPGACGLFDASCGVVALPFGSSTTDEPGFEECGGPSVEEQCETSGSCTCDQVPICTRARDVGGGFTQFFRIFCRPGDGDAPVPTPAPPSPTPPASLCPPLADFPAEDQSVAAGCRADPLGECVDSTTCSVLYREVGDSSTDLPISFVCQSSRCASEPSCRCNTTPKCLRATGTLPDQTLYRMECTDDEDDFPVLPPSTPPPPPPPTLLCGAFDPEQIPFAIQPQTRNCEPAVGQCDDGTCNKFYYRSFDELVFFNTPLNTQCSSSACDGPGSDGDACMCNSEQILTCSRLVDGTPYALECLEEVSTDTDPNARRLAAVLAANEPRCLPFSDVPLDAQPLDQDCSAPFAPRGECRLADNKCVEHYLPVGGATTDAPVERSCFVASDDAGCNSETPRCSCARYSPTCTRRVTKGDSIEFVEAFCGTSAGGRTQ